MFSLEIRNERRRRKGLKTKKEVEFSAASDNN